MIGYNDFSMKKKFQCVFLAKKNINCNNACIKDNYLQLKLEWLKTIIVIDNLYKQKHLLLFIFFRVGNSTSEVDHSTKKSIYI